VLEISLILHFLEQTYKKNMNNNLYNKFYLTRHNINLQMQHILLTIYNFINYNINFDRSIFLRPYGYTKIFSCKWPLNLNNTHVCLCQLAQAHRLFLFFMTLTRHICALLLSFYQLVYYSHDDIRRSKTWQKYIVLYRTISFRNRYMY